MIKIRLWGRLEELEQAIKDLEQIYHILSVSKPYVDKGSKGRSEYCRIYVEVERSRV